MRIEIEYLDENLRVSVWLTKWERNVLLTRAGDTIPRYGEEKREYIFRIMSEALDKIYAGELETHIY